MSLIVLQSQAKLDAVGILAAVRGTVCMASGIVLYVAWFHGIARLPASTIAFLGLLSPVVAILLG